MRTTRSLIPLTLTAMLPLIACAQQPPPAQQSTARAASQPAAPPNQLTPAETAAGWKLLFDGKKTDAWRGYRAKDFPAKGWKVEDGCLRTVKGERGGDIVTNDQYGEFELALEFRLSPHSNSGIMTRVTEQHDEAWQTGPEYQILEDQGYDVAPTAGNANGALYDLCPPSDKKVTRPVGEWNQARIRWAGGVLQHWLNGIKIVEVRTDGDDWKQRIAKSKFKDYAGFGVQPTGHIALQDYGDDVWFRNIKVRDLAAPLPGEVRLFNGKDLTGWKPVLQDSTPPDKVWSVRPDPQAQGGGVLVCQGQPLGYVRTEKDYTNYVLKVEWRFEKPGNSGVLLRVIGADPKPSPDGKDWSWPRCIEAQLLHENAGDFWNVDEFPMKVDPARTEGRNTKKLFMAERPVGEWNEYECIVDHGDVTLYVNGDLLNHAWDCLETPGKIALQSEGAVIDFRNIRLAPIE